MCILCRSLVTLLHWAVVTNLDTHKSSKLLILSELHIGDWVVLLYRNLKLTSFMLLNIFLECLNKCILCSCLQPVTRSVSQGATPQDRVDVILRACLGISWCQMVMTRVKVCTNGKYQFAQLKLKLWRLQIRTVRCRIYCKPVYAPTHFSIPSCSPLDVPSQRNCHLCKNWQLVTHIGSSLRTASIYLGGSIHWTPECWPRRRRC